MASQRAQYQRLTASVIEETEERGDNMEHDSGLYVDSGGLENGIPVAIPPSENSYTRRQLITVLILFFVNTINYMDRFTVAGILEKIQHNFGISDSTAGLIQTAFVLCYMLFAPLFGYLGDRYSRRIIMGSGVFLWTITTFLGSFVGQSFGWFILLRALVGIGEASYSTIAPTIISDMFVNDCRSRMLAVFYFAIPVGSGLGYIIGSEAVAAAGGQWQWGLRITPALGLIAVLLIVFVMIDPARGECEDSKLLPTPWKEDVHYLLKNRSFVLTTIGFTCVSFVVGAIAWWGPKFIEYGEMVQQNTKSPISNVAYKFGIITMVSGLIGVPLGSFLAQKYRKYNTHGDPLICAYGLLASTPMIFFGSLAANYNTALCFTLIFFGELFVNLNWSIVADMLLYVVVPTRRSTAAAFQILLSHALGDAGSPYIIGKVSDYLKSILSKTTVVIINSANNNEIDSQLNTTDDIEQDPNVEFHSLQYALFITCFIQVIGSAFFLLATFYIKRDKEMAYKMAAVGNDVLTREGIQPEICAADESLANSLGRI